MGEVWMCILREERGIYFRAGRFLQPSIKVRGHQRRRAHRKGDILASIQDCVPRRRHRATNACTVRGGRSPGARRPDGTNFVATINNVCVLTPGHHTFVIPLFISGVTLNV